MDPGQTYLSLEEPNSANHLWRYSPWKKVHPTGNTREIPDDFSEPAINLLLLDGSKVPEGITIVKENLETKQNKFTDPVSMNFIDAVSSNHKFTLKIKNSTVLNQPVVLRINSGTSNSAMNLTIKIGRHCEFELVTQIVGSAPWFGLIRNGEIGEGSVINDVLVGQMSFVGPRPLLVKYLDRYNDNQLRRLEVKPGLTGWAQINGRNSISWEEKFQYDVWYVDNQSLKLDLIIIFKTIGQVIRGKGISQKNHPTMEEFMGTNK